MSLSLGHSSCCGCFCWDRPVQISGVLSQIHNAVLQRMHDYKMYLCHTQSSFKYLCLYLLSFLLILFVDHLQSIGNQALSVLGLFWYLSVVVFSPIYLVLDFYHLHFDSDPGLGFVFHCCPIDVLLSLQQVHGCLLYLQSRSDCFHCGCLKELCPPANIYIHIMSCLGVSLCVLSNTTVVTVYLEASSWVFWRSRTTYRK